MSIISFIILVSAELTPEYDEVAPESGADAVDQPVETPETAPPSGNKPSSTVVYLKFKV